MTARPALADPPSDPPLPPLPPPLPPPKPPTPAEPQPGPIAADHGGTDMGALGITLAALALCAVVLAFFGNWS